MFWRRKGWLKRQFDQRLVEQLEAMRNEWMKQKDLIEKSIEPSEDVLMDAKITEAKYFFLIREAKRRRVTLKRAK
ncbi:YaaL family protein [Anoxybacillus sp. J5B_2022]|uniref:YaaL family protein n=1 Tax=Anoxybacillus sp. J5B_2022 TaxID=3003246 RepID=UPI0022861E20|nr:YaaL family protein [Anoxybacillus sp. J5B_2022]MCZ0756992.1 YaaL family protein [Anoxybacillus sp. J5B_2022]